MKRLKVKGRKFQTKINQMKAGVAVIQLDNVDFKARRITKNQEVYFTRMKGLSQHDTQQFSMYNLFNNIASKHTKQKLTELNKETNKSTDIVGDF